MDKKRGRYPWKEWFAQSEFLLVQGVHYHSRTYAMAATVRNNAGASRFNVKVKIQVAEDEKSVLVRVLGPLRRGA